MRFFYIIMVYLSIVLSIENTYSSMNYNSQNLNNTNEYESIQNNNFKNDNSQILHNFVDPDSYIIGPGDIFLFNMVTSNRIIDLELITSPTGDILIPIIGIINIILFYYMFTRLIKKYNVDYKNQEGVLVWKKTVIFYLKLF